MRWKRRESRHFVFHFTAAKPMRSEDFGFHEANLCKEAGFLRTRPPKGKIRFFFYPEKAVLRERTDFDGNALASLSGPPDDPKTRFEIHTVFPRDNHEIIHVLLFEKGLPLAMWAEGIAVCRSGSWHGKRLAEAARTVVESRASLASLLDDTRFRADEMVSYPLAGAFAEFLIERHGIGAFLDSYEGLARSGPDVSRAGIDQVLLAVYGESFKRSESLFRRWLWAARRKKGDAGS